MPPFRVATRIAGLMNETMALTNETVSREVELQGLSLFSEPAFSRAISARIPILRTYRVRSGTGTPIGRSPIWG